MTIAIEISTEQPPDITERQHRRFMNHALRTAATEHLLTRLRKHFEPTAENRPGGEYGYVAPSRKYMIRKARTQGHQTPNVFTGLERQHVLANSTVTATYRRARLVIKGLHPKREDLGRRWRETVAAVADSERSAITRTVHDTYHQQLLEHRSSRRVQQRGADGRFT